MQEWWKIYILRPELGLALLKRTRDGDVEGFFQLDGTPIDAASVRDYTTLFTDQPWPEWAPGKPEPPPEPVSEE